MVHQYIEEAWNKHIPELEGEFQECLFDGERLIQDCRVISPGAEELIWLRHTLLELKEVNRILDFGCGIGLFVDLFSGFDYTGADLTPAMLQRAKELHPDKRFVRADGSKLLETFSAGEFDLVFTRAVIQHNPEPVKSQIIQGIHDILKPGGYYLFCEHQFLLPGEAKKETADYMQQFGFELVDYKPTANYLFRRL